MGVHKEAFLKIAIVGRRGGSNIGESFMRASMRQGYEVLYLDMDRAEPSSQILRSAGWRLLKRRSLLKHRFEREALQKCRAFHPDLVLSTGMAPLSRSGLEALRSDGAVCVNFSTDDPWNLEHRQDWFLDSVCAYDIVFTPREANVSDFDSVGARRVEVLRFGYDEDLFPDECPIGRGVPDWDIFFAGGADAERARMIGILFSSGFRVLLIGSYWDRFAETRGRAMGQVEPGRLQAYASRASLGLCLVRRANRDDHSMRTYELPRMGVGIVAEESSTHRALFGSHSNAAILYKSDGDLPKQVAELLSRVDAASVRRLAHDIALSSNSYGDRLKTIVEAALGPTAGSP